MDDYFKKRNLILSVLLPWLIPMVGYSWLTFYPDPPFTFLEERCTWAFDESQRLGRAVAIQHIVLIAIVAVVVNFFNVKTLLYVHRIRRQVQTLETSANASREIKLFAQCAITGIFFTGAAVTFFVVDALKDRMTTVAFVVAHCMWILNAIQYPFIYFALNQMLRDRFLAFFCHRKQTSVYESERRLVSKKLQVKVTEASKRITASKL